MRRISRPQAQPPLSSHSNIRVLLTSAQACGARETTERETLGASSNNPVPRPANSSIKLARVAPDEKLAMDVLVAEAVLEFADDLREATEAATEWVSAQAIRR